MLDPVDLNTCDREPIHIAVSIQEHGCLLASDAAGRIMRFAGNAPEKIGVRALCIGTNLSEALTPKIAHDLFNALAKSEA